MLGALFVIFVCSAVGTLLMDSIKYIRIKNRIKRRKQAMKARLK